MWAKWAIVALVVLSALSLVLVALPQVLFLPVYLMDVVRTVEVVSATPSAMRLAHKERAR